MTEREPSDMPADDAALMRELAARMHALEADIDADSRVRLAQARRAAVAEADQRAPLLAPVAATLAPLAASRAASAWRWVGAGGIAAAALVLTLALRVPQETLPLLGDDEFAVAQDVELLNDLEFLAWIADPESADAPPGSG